MSIKRVVATDVVPGDQIQIFMTPKDRTSYRSVAMEVIMRYDSEDEITFIVFNPEVAPERKKITRDPLSFMRVYTNAE